MALRSLIVAVLVLGIMFRFTNLDRKVFSHDEVYTNLRVAGYIRKEVDRELFQNRLVSAPQLLKFQQPKPESTAIDTLRAHQIENPQHPPLYFLMARFWMEAFGSGIAASRFLPALLSLFALPLMYWLGWELFGSQLAALMATTLLAISPFDILYAQTARQYSLLTGMVIGSSALLLRALRLKRWQHWGFYSLVAALGLYTHLFFALALVAQGVYVALRSLDVGMLVRGRWRKVVEVSLFKYLGAIAGAVILFSPWLFVMVDSSRRLSSTTDWARVSVSFLYLVKLWILSFTSLFLDIDFGFDSPWTYLLRLPVLLLIGVAIYTVCRRTERSTWLFVVTAIVVPFSILALADLVSGGKRSAVTRYLIPCFPAVQLAVGYFLATKLPQGRWLWRGAMGLLLTGSVVSCTMSAFSGTWWSKAVSYFNADVAQQINAMPSPVVVSDVGDDYTNTGDLISLSYRLDEDVRLLLVSQPPQLDAIAQRENVLLFRPSESLLKAVEQRGRKAEMVFEAGRLWQLAPSASPARSQSEN